MNRSPFTVRRSSCFWVGLGSIPGGEGLARRSRRKDKEVVSRRELVSTFPDEHEVLKSSVVHLSAWGILDFWNIASPSRTGCPPTGERWRIKRRYPLSSIGREGLPAASIGVYHRGHRRVVSDMRWQIGLQKDIGLQVRSGCVSLD